jgi:Domain of unknown function (DUF4390)
MPCLAAVCQLFGHRAKRRPGGWLARALLAVAFCGWMPAPAAWAQGVEVRELKASRDETSITLDYQLRLALPLAVEGAVQRGVPVYFTAQASLWRVRWYWRDERIARTAREWRLSYQPLTSNWRVSQGGIGQSFSSLADALFAMTRIAGWYVADAREVDPDARYYIDFSWRLDTAQLPRPMQIGLGGIGGTSEWSLSIEQTVPLGRESAK